MKNDIKILIVSGDYPPMVKGVGDYSFHIFRELRRLGIFVKVITTYAKISSEHQGYDENYVKRIIAKWKLSETKKIINTVKNMGNQTVINIQYYCPDTYGRNPMINFLPLILRVFFPKCRVIITMHGFWEQSFLYRIRTLPMLRFAHGIIYVDRQNHKLLSIYSGLPDKYVKFIPISSNILPIYFTPNQRVKWRKEIDVTSKDFVVGFFGAIGRPKGFKYLIESIKIIREQHNMPLILLAIGGFHSYGKNDEYQAEIKRILDMPDIKPWVRVVHEPDPHSCSKFLHSCDLAVSPFIKGVAENSGSTLAALFHNLPVIVTEGPPDSVSFFKNLDIPVIPTESIYDLSDCILSILNSKGQQHIMKHKIAVLKNRLSWRNITKQILVFCESLI